MENSPITADTLAAQPGVSAATMQDIIENYADANYSPFPWVYFSGAILVLALLLGLVFLYVRFRRRPKKVVVKTPLEILRESLAQFEKIEIENSESFYLSLRQLLSSALSISLGEDMSVLTGEEWMVLLKTSGREDLALLIPMIGRSTEVLFAHGDIPVEVRASDRAHFLEFVKPILSPSAK